LAPRRAADPSAWLTAHRRLARDYERDPAISEAMIRWAAINTIIRRIARKGPAGPYEQTLTEARSRQTDPAWVADYRATRPKVERKLGHLMRRHHGGRRARVRGTTRVDADFRLLAAAVNYARLAVLGVRGTTHGWATAS
jgi:hypothetical protein